MTRLIISQGRNSWRITSTHRCHSVRIPGEIHPMEREPVLPAWAVWFAAAIAATFIASLIGAAA